MLTINNTIDGYLKDIEIKGNTIQDINQTGDLADIRSVGDKLENQELYEIPVLSHNADKNLVDFEPFTANAASEKSKGFDAYIPKGVTRLYYKIILNDGTTLNDGNIEVQFRDVNDSLLIAKSTNSYEPFTFEKGSLDNCKKVGFYYNYNLGVKNIDIHAKDGIIKS